MLGCNTFVHGKLQICRCWAPSKYNQTNFQNSQNWDLVQARAHISRFWKKWSKQQYTTSENLKFLNNLENWPLASSRARVLLFFVTLFCQELMIFRFKLELSCRREPNSQDIEKMKSANLFCSNIENWPLACTRARFSLCLATFCLSTINEIWVSGGSWRCPQGPFGRGLAHTRHLGTPRSSQRRHGAPPGGPKH